MAEQIEDIHISTDEFEQLLTGTRESGRIRITYDPTNGLHTKLIDAALDAELIDDEPDEGDEIEFSADFNIFLMNLADVTNNGPAPDVEPEEQPGDPGAAGGKRRSRLNKKTRRSKRKRGYTKRR